MTSRRKKEYSLPSDKKKADYVKQNFNEIAPGYDRFNDWVTFGMHRLWKKHVSVRVKEMVSETNPLILDLCTGSGDIAFFLNKQIPEAKIQAIDFSEGMLQALRKKIQASDTGKSIQVKKGDVTQLKFIKSNSASAVTMGFGLRNVNSREKTFKEILRILKPGGVYINLDVGQVNFKPVAFFHKIYFEKAVPLIGFLLHGSKHEMYCYLPASARKYPDQKSLKKELEIAGFSEVEYKNFLLGSAAMHCSRKPEKRPAARTKK